MADLNKLFSNFEEEISLKPKKKENLKKGRDALREKIRNSFKEKERSTPKFCGQGSYMMKTTVNPIDGEYDIDDGVYLQGYSDKDIEEWPTTSTVHRWIKEAVDGHTSTPPKDKNTCVRVIYVDDYHIDLPSYIVKDEVCYLAHKRDGWIESDPKAFTKWFVEKVQENGEQVRRLVKYLKAWKDYNDVDLKGIAVTILVCESYYAYENRDDLALLGTVTEIINSLENEFTCKKPVIPYEDLFEQIDEVNQNKLLESLKSLKTEIQNAVDKEDEAEASDIMIQVFGDRFPKGSSTKKEESNYVKSEAPSIIKNDGRSA